MTHFEKSPPPPAAEPAGAQSGRPVRSAYLSVNALQFAEHTPTAHHFRVTHNSKTHWLWVDFPNLRLLDEAMRQTIHTWPLDTLRLYGQDRETFTIEAGRRCPSGEGVYSFFVNDPRNLRVFLNQVIDDEKVLLVLMCCFPT